MTINTSIITRRPAASRPRGIVSLLALSLQTWKERRALARLDADALRDIGLSAEDAARESDRPIWDVPSNWTR